MDEKFLNKIVELQNLFDEGVVTTADNIPQPEPRQEVLDREAVNAFMKRNPMAGGGMLVQPTVDGSRPGYKTKKRIHSAITSRNERNLEYNFRRQRLE